jgi:hypothetical protein
LLGRKFPNGNELQFIYGNGEAEGEAILTHGDCKEEFKFAAGQKEVWQYKYKTNFNSTFIRVHV